MLNVFYVSLLGPRIGGCDLRLASGLVPSVISGQANSREDPRALRLSRRVDAGCKLQTRVDPSRGDGSDKKACTLSGLLGRVLDLGPAEMGLKSRMVDDIRLGQERELWSGFFLVGLLAAIKETANSQFYCRV